MIVVVVAVYFIYENDTHLQKPKKEQFENNVVISQPLREAVMKTYRDILKRDPEEFEVMKARGILNSDSDLGPLIMFLKGSDEYKLNIDIASRKINQSELLKGGVEPDVLKDNVDGTFASKSDVSLSNYAESSAIVQNTDLSKRMTIYRMILHVYEQNLGRLPNMKELNYYTFRMLTDKDFDIGRLEKILQASEEYRILVKNQVNTINAGMPGNITDAQITYEIRTLYKSLFDTIPSKDEEEFLKIKFVDYQLDIERLRKLLLLLKATDDSNVTINYIEDKKLVEVTKRTSRSSNNKPTAGTGTSTGTGTDTGTGTGGQQGKNGAVGEEIMSNEELVKKFLESTPNVYNIINPTQKDVEAAGNISGNIADNENCVSKCRDGKRSPCVNPYNMFPYKDELYEAIKNEGNSKPTISNRDIRERICRGVEEREKNLLAEYKQDRNMETLKVACSRNSYYLNLDDKLAFEENEEKLMPSTKKKQDIFLPSNYDKTFGRKQIGTPLDEASGTTVGSIMPKFIYKEYTP